MSQPSEPEVTYQLKAFVDGVEVYTTDSQLLEVIEQSAGTAERAVDKHIEEAMDAAEAAAEGAKDDFQRQGPK